MVTYKCDYCGKELKYDHKKTLFIKTIASGLSMTGFDIVNAFDLHKNCFEKSIKEIDKIFDKSKEID